MLFYNSFPSTVKFPISYYATYSIIYHNVFTDIITLFIFFQISPSGFLIKPTHKNGCEVGYVTHTNPRGKIPPWLTNKISSSVAPRMLQKLHKACLAYPEWKSKHRPNYKYWLNPEQITSPRITLTDVSLGSIYNVLGRSLCQIYFGSIPNPNSNTLHH